MCDLNWCAKDVREDPSNADLVRACEGLAEKGEKFFKEMEEEFKSQDKIRGIAKSTLPTIEKINFMRLENTKIEMYQVCELLGIKSSIYYRHLRTLKERSTLFSA